MTYCTNIHPGESWEETFQNLKLHIPKIKEQLSSPHPFGIGLRLSNEASLTLSEKEELQEFRSWLEENDCYVFTLNGFPYGSFHRQVVKDKVHHPDWTTTERRDYTDRLFKILETLLPEGMDGGISTSPLSYKFWHKNEREVEKATKASAIHMVQLATKLHKIKEQKGKVLHLDIEPEPDGLLENTQDVVGFYRNWLLPVGKEMLRESLGLADEEAENCLKEHVRVCYDVCHFAVVYEKPREVFATFKAEGIQVGKIQISAALKLDLSTATEEKENLHALLLPFAESTYLHQVIAKDKAGELTAYPDLPDALKQLSEAKPGQWRIHFHVPVFLERYGKLASTQQDILEVLNFIKNEKVTNHLEVETYTWDVLPEGMNLDLSPSIAREIQWVTDNIS